jgi:aspartate racemase
MRKLGMIGGIGPESTIAYYRSLLAASIELGTGVHPPILIDSIDLARVLGLVEEGGYAELTDYLVAEIEALARAGAAVAIIAANTPHVVFDDVEARSPIPLVSIVEATRDAALAMGVKRVGILGTRFTMQGPFYPAVFARAGIESVSPSEAEQAYVHRRYVEELLNSIFSVDAREQILSVVAAMKERDRIDAVVLAGTELPLLLTESLASGVPLLDTTMIHARAAARSAWALG